MAQPDPAPAPEHPLFDSSKDRLTDAAALRGLVHPLRLQLLGQLRRGGPSTASRLAAVLNVSSGLASYHLRQLHEFGFIVDADAADVAGQQRGGRERWWRAAAASTWVSTSGVDESSDAVVRDYLGVVLEVTHANARAWLDTQSNWSPTWRDIANFSDVQLSLTVAETAQLDRELGTLLARYRRHDPTLPLGPGAAVVTLDYRLYPDPSQSAPPAVDVEA